MPTCTSTLNIKLTVENGREPSALERHAAEAVAEAADYLHKAQSLLDVAETALLEEERKHAPFVSIGNQSHLRTYAEVKAKLEKLRARLAL